MNSIFFNLKPLILRFGGAFLALLSQVLIGRLLGLTELSVFYKFLLFGHVICVFAGYGMNVFLARHLALLNSNFENFTYSISALSLLLFLSFTIFFASYYFFDSSLISDEIYFPLYLLILSGGLQACLEVISSSIRSLGFEDIAQGFLVLLVPLCFLIIFLVLYKYPFFNVFKAYLFVQFFVFILAFFFWFKKVFSIKFLSVLNFSVWSDRFFFIVKCSPLYLSSSISWLLMGWIFSFFALKILTDETFAILKMSEKFAMVFYMASQALAYKYAPKYSGFYAVSDLFSLSSTVKKVSNFCFILLFPMLVFFNVFSLFFLDFLVSGFSTYKIYFILGLNSFLILIFSSGQNQLIQMSGRVYLHSFVGLFFSFLTIIVFLNFGLFFNSQPLCFFIYYNLIFNFYFLSIALVIRYHLGINTFIGKFN